MIIHNDSELAATQKILAGLQGTYNNLKTAYPDNPAAVETQGAWLEKEMAAHEQAIQDYEHRPWGGKEQITHRLLITRAWRDMFQKAAEENEVDPRPMHPLLRAALVDGYQSMVEDLDHQIEVLEKALSTTDRSENGEQTVQKPGQPGN